MVARSDHKMEKKRLGELTTFLVLLYSCSLIFLWNTFTYIHTDLVFGVLKPLPVN